METLNQLFIYFTDYIQYSRAPNDRELNFKQTYRYDSLDSGKTNLYANLVQTFGKKVVETFIIV